MKKIIVIVFLFTIFVVKVNASYIVMNQDNGEVIYQSAMHEKRLIASITKVMTAYLVINNIDLNKNITVDDEIKKAYGSSVYLEEGETLLVKDLLYALMLRSGNDAALVLAKNTSGSVEEFVNLMNKTAKDLGMNDTHFENPTGLDDNNSKNISSAYDMAILTKKAMENNTFRKVFKTKKYVCKSNKKSYSWTNKNKALFLSKYVTGGKTGYTKKAKRTLITTASKDNMNIIIVTLNFHDDFNYHINTYNNIFNTFKNYLILNKNNLNIRDSFYKGKINSFYIKNNFYYLSRKNNLKNFKIDYVLYKKKRLYNDMIVGKVIVYNGNKKIYNEPLYIKVKGNIF